MWYSDDEDDDNPEEEKERNLEAGEYDLGDEIGTRIGEHDEDPSI